MEKIINWWQHIPEHINPDIFRIGSFHLRYYGLMYIAGFATVYFLALYRIKKEGYEYSPVLIQNYFIWAIPGLIVGARLGYVLFYDLGYFIRNPIEIFCPFEFSGGVRYTGIYGMSYHGGVAGIILVSIFFCRKYKINFWRFADFFSPLVPLGFTFGRIGNFINGELYGRATDVPWGMYFPLDPGHRLRHPSQLYEALLEGLFLFLILWAIRKKRFFPGFHFSIYIILYGAARFLVEFVRQPDPHIGFVAGPFTLGQVLSGIMIICGVVIFVVLKGRRQYGD